MLHFLDKLKAIPPIRKKIMVSFTVVIWSQAHDTSEVCLLQILLFTLFVKCYCVKPNVQAIDKISYIIKGQGSD